jgi:two-component system cell cycle sensor histidine kinase/response regulator CckA
MISRVTAGRVLVVDDDDALLEAARRILSNAGHTVVTAGSAEEALQVFHASGPFDLLLTDVVMPGLDGLALTDELRAAHGGPSVLYMSGYSGTQLDAGSDGAMIAKPFRAEFLVRSVKQVLAARAQSSGQR